MKSKWDTVLTLSVITFFSIAGYAQKAEMAQRRAYLVDPGRPSVYISVDKSVKSVRIGEDQVLLRLVNNLRWKIRLFLSPPKEGAGDARLDYDLVNDEDSILFSQQCHVCTLTLLDSGKSLRFVVPSDKLRESRALRIKFSFVWEKAIDAEEQTEPTHYVNFIPKRY